jgi:hypothetical protein
MENVLAFPFLSSSWSFILACFPGEVMSLCDRRHLSGNINDCARLKEFG